MFDQQYSPAAATPPASALAAHVLNALAAARSEGVRLDLDSLSAALDVRRSDVRAVLSRLHREGFVDAQRMQLTLAGFAVAHALDGALLPPLRRASQLSRRPSGACAA